PGNSFAHYEAANGFRVLDITPGTGEYDTFGTAGATSNVRETLSANLDLGAGTTTVNALVIDNIATPGLRVEDLTGGAGAGTDSLLVTSGAFLFTTSGATATGTTYDTTLADFENGITVGPTVGSVGNEYIFHVVNPDFSDNTIVTNAIVASNLTSTAALTKSGRGVLTLQGTNTAISDVNLNDGTLVITDNDNVGGDSGAFNFAGGTLELGGGYADDLSGRTINYLTGTTSTLNLGGNAVGFAGSLGSGAGDLVISGGSVLTLNAASTRTGDTSVEGAGTSVALGATANVFGTGDLSVSNGADLNLGANDLEVGGLFTLGLGGTVGTISGTGRLTSNVGFFIDHGTGSTINALLSGTGGLIKADRNNFLALRNDLNDFSGPIENRRGTFSYTTIANVGGGASSLGAPTTVENGAIRHAFGGDAATFRFVGTTNQSSDRIHLLTGTTGGLIIENDADNGNAAATETLDLGVVSSAEYGVKTLTLRGTSLGASSIDSLQGQIGPVSLSKTEAGSWTVRNESAYTGTTEVNDGTLILNGNSLAASAGDITVAAGATLGGSDGGSNTFGNNATISGNHHAGSTLGSGTDLVGVQTFTGNLTYDGAPSTVTWDLINNVNTGAGTAFDQFAVAGTLDFSTTTDLVINFDAIGSSVDWTNTFWDSDQSWDLYTSSSTILNAGNLNLVQENWLDSAMGDFNSLRAGPNGSSFALDISDPNRIVLNFTAVPEPSTFGLMGLGLAAFGWCARRKRRKNVTQADEA
ncbi:MAG: PEP-CTERM sorting domain-containing protein, partial [Verrucomicrobiales bacterium]|nr:PEP-CTERM sorting domain-containing protein [Verrucomicrobiales bacterium]